MSSPEEVSLLVVTGTVGVGKSAVLNEIHAVLRRLETPHACIDLDALRLSWPERGAFNEASVLENLRAVWANFHAAGATRFVVAAVLESTADLSALCDAIPGARPIVCLLDASEATRRTRLRMREVGTELQWHIDRTTELQSSLDGAALHDFAVVNDARLLADVAREVLNRAGWMRPHVANTAPSGSV